MLKLRNLGRGGYPGLSPWTKVIIIEQGGRTGDVKRTYSPRRYEKDSLTNTGFHDGKKGTCTNECRQSPEARKGRETDSPRSSMKVCSPDILILAH